MGGGGSCEYLADLSPADGTRCEMHEHMESCPTCASLWSPAHLAPARMKGVAAVSLARRGRLGEGGGWLVGGLAAVLLLPLLSLPFPAARGHHLPSRPLLSHRVLPPAHPPLLAAASNVAIPAAAFIAQSSAGAEARPVSVNASAVATCLNCMEPTVDVPAAGSPIAGSPIAEAPVAEPPVAEPPVAEPPVAEPPVAEPPVAEPPVAEPPVTEAPVADPSVTEATA
jgi:hypothetical protein